MYSSSTVLWSTYLVYYQCRSKGHCCLRHAALIRTRISLYQAVLAVLGPVHSLSIPSVVARPCDTLCDTRPALSPSSPHPRSSHLPHQTPLHLIHPSLQTNHESKHPQPRQHRHQSRTRTNRSIPPRSSPAAGPQQHQLPRRPARQLLVAPSPRAPKRRLLRLREN